MNEQRIEVVDITQETPKIPVFKPESKIYIRSIEGKFESIRKSTGLIFLAIFLILPWIRYSGSQAVLLDFTAQRFHLFGLTLWPQDLTILAWIFIISAFALFFITTLRGRVWCGFMCPQTVFTFLFVAIEEFVEGSKNKRIHLDKQSVSTNKVVKKTIKHGLWLFVSLVTAITFVGYFVPIKSLVIDIVTFDLTLWPFIYVLLFTACTYGNAGWMREVMCIHMCPYSRFQSSMFDNNTVTVTYDNQRGDKRGPRSKKLTQEQRQKKGLGDCIDCNLCVDVCPTGIDIRNGLQYECIDCGACVDACNNVMTNMGYEKNLISFTSANALQGKKTVKLRPSVVGYLVVLVIMLAALTLDIYTRKPLGVEIIRDRTTLYREATNGNIENVYTLVIMNKSQHRQVVNINVHGLNYAKINGTTNVAIDGAKMIRHPISVEVDQQHLDKTVNPIVISVTNQKGELISQDTTFISNL
ncbi:cytochrome c oxidase accessory protein CcoG [Aliiglaciecola lipolytica]|uniref:cytochrome c oxidase accessory protein CcoG n=1 Tax=Aliiglaciecola lipolytica TaxID=477689 RepID=UPI001C0A38B5|nr:cytochrome c oxidase accessory protein CcoG [Aliiglaciecola lipolytica]MBU2879263.1 cytochrome c oxidase accessory protein CcoG [Aliiglaciecola lipolytica]